MKGKEKKNPKKKDRERKRIKNFKNKIFGGQSRLEIAPCLGLRTSEITLLKTPKAETPNRSLSLLSKPLDRVKETFEE
jgi:hypothetical protein